MNVHKEGFLLDIKQSFKCLLKAERVNSEDLVAVHQWEKLNIKLQLIKIKHFDMFFTQPKFQQLTSTLLISNGVKGYYSPNVMTVLAEQNSKKGDHDKATQYI
jgi:hypothetical protein